MRNLRYQYRVLNFGKYPPPHGAVGKYQSMSSGEEKLTRNEKRGGNVKKKGRKGKEKGREGKEKEKEGSKTIK